MITIYTDFSYLFVKDVDLTDKNARRDEKRFVRTEPKGFQEVPDWVKETPIFKMNVGKSIKIVATGEAYGVDDDIETVRANLAAAQARIAELEGKKDDPEPAPAEKGKKKGKDEPEPAPESGQNKGPEGA